MGDARSESDSKVMSSVCQRSSSHSQVVALEFEEFEFLGAGQGVKWKASGIRPLGILS